MTNIIHAGQAPSYGNIWQGIGPGITQLGQVLGSAMQANDASKLLKAQNEAKLAAGTDFNPIIPPTPVSQTIQPTAQSSPLIGTSTQRQPMQLSEMLSQYFNLPSY